MSKRLEGKVAIVVGGGQRPSEGTGNGRASSLLFAREGAKVVVADCFLDRAQATVDLILAEGNEAFPYAADVTKEDQVKAMFAACKNEYGKIDIMFNNVGIIPSSDTGIETTPEDVWDTIMDVNLKGGLFCCRHVLPYMVAQGSGCILQNASMIGVAVSTRKGGNIAYAISKCAVIRLTECVAAQYAADGIRANVILPGMVETPFGIEPYLERGMKRQEAMEFRNSFVPLKGVTGTAWDVAYAALYLASDEAKFVTGVTLAVDGGSCVKRG